MHYISIRGNMNTSNIKIAAIALMISVFTIAPSLAIVEEEPDPTPTPNPTPAVQEPTQVAPRDQEVRNPQPVVRTQEQLNKEAERNERIKKNCEINKKKVLAIKTRSEVFQTKHQEIYTGWSEKVTELVAKLDAAGADVAQLKTDIETLNTMIVDKNSEFAVYHQALNTLGTDAQCGENPAGFYTALQTGRTARKQVLASLQEIKVFIQDTIKVDFQDIKAQLTSSNAPEEG